YFTNLIQKDRSALGRFKSSETPLVCPREGAPFVSEQFRGNEGRRNSRAIYSNEGSRRTIRPAMYGASDQLFSRSSFSRDQDCRIRRRNLRHLRQHSPQGFGRANDLLKHRNVFDFLSQRDVFVSYAIFSLLAIFDVGRGSEPPDYVSGFIEQRIVATKEPAIPPILPEQSLLHLERPSL